MDNTENISNFKENLPEKIHALLLGTGYVETASWSRMMIFNREGFDSLFDACQSIRRALIKVIRLDEWRQPAKDTMPEGEDLIDALRDLLHEIICGDFQDGMDFYECMEDEGWEFPYKITRELFEYTWLTMNCAPEIISLEKEIADPNDEYDFWEQCMFHVEIGDSGIED